LDSIILFTGETGTGKTRSAQLIHEFSSRRRNPFLVVDCGALAESLIESELFGHCKGAFTGADTDRMGKFAAAANGTLFLDDVDTLPLSVQCKLLRVVENRVFEAVGSDKPLKLKARLLVASNRNLEDEVVAGRFRSDLYYRLNVIECRLPPLRKRKPAIRPIAERFLIEIADRNGRSVPQISGEALQTLETYDWPGNLRELRNVIEQASVLRSGDKIRLEDLSEHLLSSRSRQVSATTTAFSSSHAVDADRPRAEEISDAASVLSDDSQTVPGPTDSEILVMAPKKLAPLPLARAYGEIKRIKQALIETCNNRSQAARELGISRVALYKKLHKYGLINFGQKLVGSGVNCGASGE
jgi:DNA-binding NtrC family response regulator